MLHLSKSGSPGISIHPVESARNLRFINPDKCRVLCEYGDAADRAGIIIGKILKWRSGFDSLLWLASHRIIDIPTDNTPERRVSLHTGYMMSPVLKIIPALY